MIIENIVTGKSDLIFDRIAGSQRGEKVDEANMNPEERFMYTENFKL